MEKLIPVQTHRVIYICDDCQLGEMVADGTALMSYPAQYRHICDNCGDVMYFQKLSYPRIVQEEIPPAEPQ